MCELGRYDDTVFASQNAIVFARQVTLTNVVDLVELLSQTRLKLLK